MDHYLVIFCASLFYASLFVRNYVIAFKMIMEKENKEVLKIPAYLLFRLQVYHAVMDTNMQVLEVSSA